MAKQTLKFIRRKTDPHCLYVRFNGFEHRIARWDLTMNCEARMSGEWVPFDNPELSLFRTAKLPSTDKPLHWLLREIPDDVRKQAAQIRYLQIPALRLMRLTPYAQDLLQDVPALFWILCDKLSMRRITYGRAGRLIAGKRRNIITELLGETVFTPSLFRKIRFQRYDEEAYFGLLWFIEAERENPAIRHAQNLGTAVRYAYFDDRRIISQALVNECVACGKPQLLERAYRIGEYILEHGNNYLPPLTFDDLLTCKTYRQLDRFDTEMRSRPSQNYQALVEENDGMLPPPPVAGTDMIVPITTLRELLQESREMQNCVYSLASKVYAGEWYFYRVLAPERATLGIRTTSRGTELKCVRANNNEPAEQTLAYVNAWFARAVKASRFVMNYRGSPTYLE